ncbi:MAG: type II toxin-antitoxin system VapC family toxin [Leptolyngbya sp. SIO3F4]|nr:type II toxin-antitoxin system VapC family toxin [Leptolyngbya sp. SIO3F4]
MRYLLDTGICAAYLNGQSPTVRDRLLSISTEEVVICSIVKAELYYGAMLSSNPTRTLEHQQNFLDRFVSMPFDDEAALACGQMRAYLANEGFSMGSHDLQIAAIALVKHLILITQDVQKFEQVWGLQLEDWSLEKVKL